MIRPTKPKAEKSSIGSKASRLAEAANSSLANTVNTISAVSNAITTGTAASKGAAIDLKQAIGGGGGMSNGSQRHDIERQTDIFGGLTMPEMDFQGMMPSDLLNPSISVTASEEQLTAGMETYAGATRAQKLYQAAFKYIGEIGKTKQEYHKAQASIIKSATEGIKVQQEIVRFDRQNIELDIDIVKLEQSYEKLNQEGIKLTGLQKETTQIIRKIEAMELRRDAEIKGIEIQTQQITQKYLVESMN